MAPSISSAVRVDDGALVIDGEPRIVLCASLFYFRIPRGEWRARMRAVRDAGYHCIDVYLPWNHHERQPGAWEFTGERDVAAFLDLAHEEGLWVLARPGPYICSEWDGGGLPAHVIAQCGTALRQADTGYLAEVRRWYDQVLPILASRQLGTGGGSVVAVQLENELDFYDCADPSGYLAALRDMACEHGLTVPLVACAGQSDIARAGGRVAGVVPACNFYPDDASPAVEESVAVMAAELRRRGSPLLVTETNRRHATLRRLLSCGAKLLGPYLQAGGHNFGFTNAVNNWGEPLALLTSDYDFGGCIDPDGHARPEAAEGRLLRRLVTALGPALGRAVPTTSHGIGVTAAFPATAGPPRGLALDGGGVIVAVPNLGDADGPATLALPEAGPAELVPMTVGGGRCPFVVVDLPLSRWQVAGRLVFSTAEPLLLRADDRTTLLALHGTGTSTTVLDLPAGSRLRDVDGEADAELLPGTVPRLRVTAAPAGMSTVDLPDGRVLRVRLFDSASAAALADVSDTGEPLWRDQDRAGDRAVARPAPALSFAMSPTDPALLAGQWRTLGERPMWLEHVGVYRGFGGYRASVSDLDAAPRGLLLRGAADVVSAYAGNVYLGTVTPGGATAFLDLPADTPREPLTVTTRVEIWGHSNFDDPRLPALRLTALRGLADAVVVTAVCDLADGWTLHPAAVDDHRIGTDPPPVARFGGWLHPAAQDPATPHTVRYEKDIPLSTGADSWTLHLPGIVADAVVAVNGNLIGRVPPRDPYLDITAAVAAAPRSPAHLAVTLTRHDAEPAGAIRLLEGRTLRGWQVSGADEDALRLAAGRHRPAASTVDFPVRMAPGEVCWLYADVSALGGGGRWRIRPAGANLKVTAMLAGHVLGRLWLVGPSRPTLTGGSNESFPVPPSWLPDAPSTAGHGGDAVVAMLLEAVEPAAHGVLTAVTAMPA